MKRLKYLKYILQHGLCLDEWRHAGAEVDGGAWTLLCGSGTDNSPAGVASYESRPPRLLAGASVVEARRWRRSRLGSSVEVVAVSGLATAKRQRTWRWARQSGPGGECGVEEAAGDGARHDGGAALRVTGGGEAKWGGRMGTTSRRGREEKDVVSIGVRGHDEWVGLLGK